MFRNWDFFESKIQTIIKGDKGMKDKTLPQAIAEISNSIIINLKQEGTDFNSLMCFHNIRRRYEIYNCCIKIWSQRRVEHFSDAIKEEIWLVLLIRYLTYVKCVYEKNHAAFGRVNDTSADMADVIGWFFPDQKSRLSKLKNTLRYVDLQKWINRNEDYLIWNLIREWCMQYMTEEYRYYKEYINQQRHELFNVFGIRFTDLQWTQEKLKLLKKVNRDFNELAWNLIYEADYQLYNLWLAHNIKMLTVAVEHMKK